MSSMKDDGDFPYLQNEKGLILQGYVARTASFISFRDRENSYHLSKPKNTIVGILDARLVLASRGCLAEGNCRLEVGNCLEDTSTNPCCCERFARQARVISRHYLGKLKNSIFQLILCGVLFTAVRAVSVHLHYHFFHLKYSSCTPNPLFSFSFNLASQLFSLLRNEFCWFFIFHYCTVPWQYLASLYINVRILKLTMIAFQNQTSQSKRFTGRFLDMERSIS
jgi:hypothetical protein